MAKNLENGIYHIVSLTGENRAIGIDYENPVIHDVLVGGAVREWVMKRVGDNKYLIVVDGHPCTTMGDKVVVSERPSNSHDNLEWVITFGELQNAYTIALGCDPSQGWTINGDDREVSIKPIIAAHSIPPRFLPMQLFRLERL